MPIDKEGITNNSLSMLFILDSILSESLELSYFKILLTKRSTTPDLELFIFWFFFCFLLGLRLNLRSLDLYRILSL